MTVYGPGELSPVRFLLLFGTPPFVSRLWITAISGYQGGGYRQSPGIQAEGTGNLRISSLAVSDNKLRIPKGGWPNPPNSPERCFS